MDLQKQALPFEYKEPEYDFDGIPADVSSYLSSVRNESDRLAVFRTRKRKREETNKTESSELEDEHRFTDIVNNSNNTVNNSNNALNIDIQWRESFIKSFKEKKRIYNESEEENNELIDTIITTSLTTRADNSKETSPQTSPKLPNNFTGWRLYMIETKPQKKVVFSLSHATIIKLIIYMKKFIESSLKGYIDRWAIVLLLRLNEVLVYDHVHELREVGKKMIQLLKKESVKSEETKLLCKIILVVITDIYGQKDLMYGT